MIVKKIIDGIKTKKIIDLKYIIIELALIFTGITLAAKYNQYQNNLQDEKFLKEAITQIYSELKTDNKVNTIYCNAQKKRTEDIIKLKNILLNKNTNELNTKEIKAIISYLPNTLSLSNSMLGFKKLETKNINLIEDSKTKNNLINYYNMMAYNQIDLNNFNDDIAKVKPFILKYFKNYSLWDNNYDAIIDSNKLVNDTEFLNTINFIISDLKTNIDTNEMGIIPRSREIINELEEKYKFLKEKK